MRLALLSFSVALLATASVAQPRPEELVREGAPGEQRRVQAELGPRFRLLETDHFRVISDTSPRYHSVVSGVLEQFHQQVRSRFFDRDMQPLSFYLIDGGLDYERFMRQRGLEGGSYGQYDPRTRTLYARRHFPDGRESGVGTLFHEATHAMIEAEFGASPAPVWFHEGFASLFEAGRVLRGRWVYGNPNPWRETPFRAAFEAGEVLSLAAYFALDEAAFRRSPEQQALYYNTGRSLFLYVLMRHGEPALRSFIQALQSGGGATPALEQATGLPLARIQDGWHASIRSVNFAGDYLNRGTGPNALDVLAEGARKHPGYGNLRIELAAAYLQRGDSARALEHARAALQDPRCIFPQQADAVIARAAIGTDPNEAARALSDALSHQPWNEQILEDEFEMLARMFELAGDRARATAIRAELARLKGLDRSPPS